MTSSAHPPGAISLLLEVVPDQGAWWARTLADRALGELLRPMFAVREAPGRYRVTLHPNVVLRSGPWWAVVRGGKLLVGAPSWARRAVRVALAGRDEGEAVELDVRRGELGQVPLPAGCAVRVVAG